MIVEKLMNNRFIAIPVPFDQALPAPPVPIGQPPGFVHIPDRFYNISASSRVKGWNRMSTIGVGAHPAKPHRTFRWLPFARGQITFMLLNGSDIVTGRMTGCWLATFQMAGHVYAAHIGTDSESMLNTAAVHHNWRNAVNGGLIAPMRAFEPAASINLLDPALRGRTAAFYGGLNQVDSFAIALTQERRLIAARQDVWKVSIVQAPPTSPDVTAF